MIAFVIWSGITSSSSHCTLTQSRTLGHRTRLSLYLYNALKEAQNSKEIDREWIRFFNFFPRFKHKNWIRLRFYLILNGIETAVSWHLTMNCIKNKIDEGILVWQTQHILFFHSRQIGSVLSLSNEVFSICFFMIKWHCSHIVRPEQCVCNKIYTWIEIAMHR